MDDLHALWAAHDAKLDRSLRLNEHLLRETTLARTRGALAWVVASRAIGIVFGIATVALLGAFVADHAAEPGYLACGLATQIYVASVTATSIYQVVLLGRIDYTGSILAIQRAIERVKRVEYRAFLWALGAGIVIWAPASLVLGRALGADPLASVAMAWLASNVALGAILLAVAVWWSRKYVEGPDTRPWARRLVDRISGRGLARATAVLADLDRFQREV